MSFCCAILTSIKNAAKALRRLQKGQKGKISMAKTIIVGDIHGCLKEFQALLPLTGLDEQEDTLVILGDIIDRGPDSYGVLRKILRLKAKMGGRLHCIMGNHEDMAIKAIQTNDRVHWNRNGGGKTRKSFFKHKDPFQRYVGYLEELHLYYETDAFLCVHAGAAEEGPKATDRHTFLWDREIAGGKPYGGKLLIFGHTSADQAVYRDEKGRPAQILKGDHPLPKKGSICLDTGCVYGGRLSAMVIEKGTFHICSQEAAKEEPISHQPPEKYKI